MPAASGSGTADQQSRVAVRRWRRHVERRVAAKNPVGLSMKPVRVTGMTGQSSGRGKCVGNDPWRLPSPYLLVSDDRADPVAQPWITAAHPDGVDDGHDDDAERRVGEPVE